MRPLLLCLLAVAIAACDSQEPLPPEPPEEPPFLVTYTTSFTGATESMQVRYRGASGEVVVASVSPDPTSYTLEVAFEDVSGLYYIEAEGELQANEAAEVEVVVTREDQEIVRQSEQKFASQANPTILARAQTTIPVDL
ncbi:MAG: hypothetical protein AAGK21_03685 [Bacteroidota bacterium]